MSGSRATRFVSCTLLVAGFLGLNLLCSAAQNQAPASNLPPETDDAAAAAGSYGDTYTPEELAAMDTALHAVNMDRIDLNFKKDYAKGYECFPMVRAEMADPLRIAQDMDQLAAAGSASTADPAISAVIAAARLGWGEDQTMPYEEWAASSEWNYNLAQASPYKDWTAEYLRTVAETDYMHFAGDFAQDQPAFDALRLKLPLVMAWHDAFAAPPDLDAARIAELETWIEEQVPQWYMNKLQDSYYNTTGLATDYLLGFAGLAQWARTLPPEFFPTNTPLIMDSPAGAVVVGTLHDDVYTELDCALVIEPGGDDTYVNCRLAGVSNSLQRVNSAFIDLGGNDYYDCADTNMTLGAAVLGVAAFYDLGAGNDRYFAGHCSLGAAMAGIATFYDDGGSDYYSGKTYTQGAAGFGLGIMVDDSVQAAPVVPTDVETPEPIDWQAWDNDSYEAWGNAQAFARTRGVALCLNRRGNEVYHAGGVYLHAPLFQDRYQSFSQGFAIGERDIDYAGGIAMLADYAGNDRYLGDIYNQGVGYWYSAGFLYDEAGNDLFEMTQYGQGSGIHLAIGGLVDNAGNDTYVMHSGLGQGGSHDFAASVQMDRGGNDHYMGMTSCNGTGLTNSVGLFFDRSGDDTYAARSDGYFNGGRPDRNSGSIGLFVDLAGKDDYLGIAGDGYVWASTFYGAGIDITPPPAPEPEFASEGAANVVTGAAPVPEVCSYEGPLTQEVFDELWEISVRWEVGDNRYIVPKARERIAAFGPEVIPYLDGKLNNDNSGLAQRAYMDILPVLIKDAPEQVADMLRSGAQSDDEIRRNQSLYLIGELKLTNCEAAVVAQLSNPDPAIQRRAIGVLGLIGSHAADAQLIAMLDPAADEAQLRIALTTLTDLKVDCYEQLRPLLDYPMVTVREALINQLVKHWDLFENHVSTDVLRGMLAYGKDVYSEEMAAKHKQELERLGIEQMDAPIKAEDATSTRALRTLLTVLARETDGPRMLNVAAGMKLLGADDWGLRADAVRLVKHWQQLQADGVEVTDTVQYAIEQLEALKMTETDPYVKFVAEQ